MITWAFYSSYSSWKLLTYKAWCATWSGSKLIVESMSMCSKLILMSKYVAESINQTTDCRTFWPHRPLSTAYKSVLQSVASLIDSATYLLIKINSLIIHNVAMSLYNIMIMCLLHYEIHLQQTCLLSDIHKGGGKSTRWWTSKMFLGVLEWMFALGWTINGHINKSPDSSSAL